MKKLNNFLFFLTVVFIYSSCQKCVECTNEKLLNNQAGVIEYETEICEDDFEESDFGMSFDEYIQSIEESDPDVRCYKNLW
tara:strand:+ start:234 stop:476 length:243 start_codon:yes stop_codon:yes gene_type:complete